MARTRKSYAPELKAQVVLELLAEKISLSQACERYKVKQQAVSRWKAEFLRKAPKIFEMKDVSGVEQERIAELERMVGRLTMELGLLKKASSLLNSL